MHARRPVVALFAIAVVFLADYLRGADQPFTVDVRGEGPPMLFLPGLTCPGAVWDETVAHYAKSYECHVFSLAGFAGTPAMDLEGGFLLRVRDALIAYIEDRNLARPVVVGHSLGGFLALGLGIDLGDDLGGLVIVDGLPFFPAAMNPAATVESTRAMAEQTRQQMAHSSMSREQLSQMQRGMLQSMVTAPEDRERALEWSLASDQATVAQAMYEMNTTDLRADLAKISVPTLVLGAWIGYRQYGATRESTEAIFRAQYSGLPGYRLAMTDHARHFIMLDDPEFLLGEIDGWLAERD